MSRIIPSRLQPADPMWFVGDRREVALSRASELIPTIWGDFMATTPLPGQIGNETYGITCAYDGTNIEYMAGVRVENFANLDAAIPNGRVAVPAAEYAVFTHVGANEKIPETWEAIMDWIHTNGRYKDGASPPLEIYGDKYDPTSENSQFEIWFPVVLA